MGIGANNNVNNNYFMNNQNMNNNNFMMNQPFNITSNCIQITPKFMGMNYNMALMGQFFPMNQMNQFNMMNNQINPNEFSKQSI